MTETNLFKQTLLVLGATILAPLLVAATGLGAGDKPLGDRLSEYLGVSSVKTDDKESAKDEQKANDDTSSVDGKSTASDDTSKKESTNGTNAASEKTTTSPTATAGAKAASTYTVKAGDTYGCIAEKYYGSYDQWPLVYQQNAGWPGFNEYDLAIGAKLTMPAVSAGEALPKTNLCN